MKPGNSITFRRAEKNRGCVGGWIRPTSKRPFRSEQARHTKVISASPGWMSVHHRTRQRGSPMRIAIRNFRRQRASIPATIVRRDTLETKVLKLISTRSRHYTLQSRSSAKACAGQSRSRLPRQPNAHDRRARATQNENNVPDFGRQITCYSSLE